MVERQPMASLRGPRPEPTQRAGRSARPADVGHPRRGPRHRSDRRGRPLHSSRRPFDFARDVRDDVVECHRRVDARARDFAVPLASFAPKYRERHARSRKVDAMNVVVDLGDRSYDVVLAEGARHQLAELIARRAASARVAVLVTTPSVAAQPWFNIASGIDQHLLTVPDGEAAKTLDVFEVLLEEVAQFELSRSDVLIGVGGGALTDLVGFVAATYLRGVSLVQIPTTLVGQVDAAIGGKTGVNLRSGKNLVGAFHQPIGVLCDFETITTLPERERLSGLGEVAKCWILEGGFAAELTDVSLHDLVVMSVKLKAAIVSADEHEGGRRALMFIGADDCGLKFH